jgi:ubiquinone/menaquinone biosynthesis C-methylase UbiE
MSLEPGAPPVKEAFSRQSGSFDAIDAANPLIGWVRDRVRAECLKYIAPGDTLLELNAGTGIDSVHFARLGVQVLATDQAPGMIAQLQAKQGSERRLEVMELSYHELPRLGDRTFDHIFSNFGGLNCTAHLDTVLRDAHQLLRPHGHMHLVIMPRTCLWELAWVLKGRPREAFRRFRTGGTVAQLEGVRFDCHYYDPQDVLRMLPEGYRVRALLGLSVFYPPPHMQAKATRWPRITRWLERVENRLHRIGPFNRWGDHYLLIVQRGA